MAEHNIDIRIYYEDTDAGGIVYHSNYLNFAERARCEMLREFDLECSRLQDEQGFLFVVKHADIDYLKPARLDDALQVKSAIIAIGNTSFKMRQIVQKDGVELCRMHITLVCVNPLEVRPVRVPEILRERLKPYIDIDR